MIVKGTGQTFALMYLTFASSEMTPEQVTEYLTRVVQPRFATLEGVGSAEILGGHDFAMRVWVDPIRLAARNVTAADVVAAIRASNFLSAPGRTKNEFVAYALEPQTTLQTPEAFGALPVRATATTSSGCATWPRSSWAPKSTDTIVTFNGKEGTFIGVTPTPSANPLTVAEAVTKAMDDIQPTLPEGMTAEIVYDASNFIEASIDEVVQDHPRGGGDRRRRHPAVPRLVPLGAHPGRHHPAVADRRLLRASTRSATRSTS